MTMPPLNFRGRIFLQRGELIMTQREEAIALLEKLPDKVMGDILRHLKRIADDPRTLETPEQTRARKMRAFQKRVKASCYDVH